jgi:hypothetical protein
MFMRKATNSAVIFPTPQRKVAEWRNGGMGGEFIAPLSGMKWISIMNVFQEYERDD